MAIGELGELVLDGLFALDGENALFPGVTSPSVGNRIVGASIGPVSFSRTSHRPQADAAYRRLMGAPKREFGEESQEVSARLGDAAVAITKALLLQRMLAAKIGALAEKFREPDLVTDADKTLAEALLGAAEEINELVQKSVRPNL